MALSLFRKHPKARAEELRRTLEAFEYWFGKYPFYEDSYKLVVVPYLGMEHQSSVTYGNGFQNGYRGRDLSKTGVSMKFDFIVVHETAHEWWGNNISMKDAAEQVSVPIVTGDTKVVDRGKGDGAFINTTGIGVQLPGVDISPRNARPGDAVLINGPIAVHGIAVMSIREGLEFETTVKSDSAPLHDLVQPLLHEKGPDVRVLRDPTRGGVASALNEIAAQAGVGMRLTEQQIPVGEQVRGACEILGFDPLYVANEGKLLAIVERKVADEVLETMRHHPLGGKAAIIGEVVEDHPKQVFMRSRIGGLRIVDMLSGEQLPRIC